VNVEGVWLSSTLLSRSRAVPWLGFKEIQREYSRFALLEALMLVLDTFHGYMLYQRDPEPAKGGLSAPPAWLISFQGCAQSALTELTVIQNRPTY
jgi:hypothetical protein